ncbi:MAG: metal-dependent transcriptional regulator [Desulfobulbaceae bacterium]|nr:metal-dependent transcriptional regulator [Desulfobulbaceae bacterium]
MQELSASMEDYLEAIYLTMQSKDKVRSGDLAARLNVSSSSVTEALRLLRDKGLVKYVRYGSVSLTGTGLAAAKDVYYRHCMLARFLVEVLGVDAAMAEESACRLEHAIAPDILRRFVAYMHFTQEPQAETGEPGPLVRAFQEFYRRELVQDKEDKYARS